MGTVTRKCQQNIMPANGELAGVKLSKSNAGEYNKKFKRLEACQDNSKEIKG